MGGSTSGNRRRRERKTTVEETLEFSISELRDCIYDGSTDVIAWYAGTRKKAAIRYQVDLSGVPEVTLYYQVGKTEIIRVGISLEKRPLHFGGHRWWFICPLQKGNSACVQRAGKLYLPKGAKYFGCRKCHDLTYHSSQNAHQEERAFAMMMKIRRKLQSNKTD